MARWRMWIVSSMGAAAAGAGLAVARRRRPAAPGAPGDMPAPPPPPAPPPSAEDDPQAALDAARDRLRGRADALRQEIEGSGRDPGGEGGG